jgi:hypothetical protein
VPTESIANGADARLSKQPVILSGSHCVLCGRQHIDLLSVAPAVCRAFKSAHEKTLKQVAHRSHSFAFPRTANLMLSRIPSR